MSKGRRARRVAELTERREQRRRRATPRRGLPAVRLTIAGLLLGGAAVAAFAIATLPPPEPPIGDIRSPTQPTPYALADGNALGAADAPLTVEVWSDYQCPACTLLARTQVPQLIADYVEEGLVRLVYRDFAFLGRESIDAAAGARCAERQGRFWQFHDHLFANHGGENAGAFSAGRLEAIAQHSGLHLDQFRACRADPQLPDQVAAERSEGQRLGVTSTPTLFVGEQMIVGVPRTYEDLRTVIDAGLAQASTGLGQ